MLRLIIHDHQMVHLKRLHLDQNRLFLVRCGCRSARTNDCNAVDMCIEWYVLPFSCSRSHRTLGHNRLELKLDTNGVEVISSSHSWQSGRITYHDKGIGVDVNRTIIHELYTSIYSQSRTT